MDPTPSANGASDGVVAAFASAWDSAPPAPDLSSFVNDAVRADEGLLVKLVHLDAQRRQHRGEPVQLEHYARAISPEAVGPGSAVTRVVLGYERFAGVSASDARKRLGDAYAADIEAVFTAEQSMLTMDADDALRVSEPDSHPEADALMRGWSRGDRLGRYKLRTLLGAGTFGEVWLAERRAPDLLVAIKVLKPGMTDKDRLRRFEAEAQALAFLEHQYIATIHDAGTARELPFIAMEYVEGKPLARYCDDRRMSLEQRLELMVRVCEGVQHAHQRGLIHRDLKPDNIFVTEILKHPDQVEDTERRLVVGKRGESLIVAVPKLLDFGLAKAAIKSVRLADGSLTTDLGKILGTLQYMAPEQAGHRPNEVTQKADIFSLGVILFELLSGTLPLSGEWLHSLPVAVAGAVLRDTERPEPAVRFDELDEESRREVAGRRGEMTSEELSRRLRSRLRYLCDKALRLEPDKRFSSAAALGRDIRNFLEDKDFIEAAAEPRSERILRHVRSNRLPYAAAVAVFMALVVGFVATSLQWRRAVESENRALDAAARTRRQLILAQANALGERDPSLAKLVLRELSERDSDPLNGSRMIELANAQESLVRRLLGHEHNVNDVAWSPDGQSIATASYDGTVRLWSATSGNEGVVLGRHDGWVYLLNWDPTGAYLVSAGNDGTARIWDVQRRVQRAVLQHGVETLATTIDENGARPAVVLPTGVDEATWDPTGRYVLTIARSGFAAIWDRENAGEEIHRFTLDSRVLAAGWSPDGKWVLTGHADGRITMWEASTGKLKRAALYDGPVTAVVWCGNFGSFAVATGKGDVYLLAISDAPGAWKARPIFSGGSGITRLAFSGGTLAAVTDDGQVIILHARNGQALSRHAIGEELRSIHVSPDGTHVAVGCASGRILVWRTIDPPAQPIVIRAHAGPIEKVRWNADGTRLASASMDKSVRIWDPSSFTERAHDSFVREVAWSPDGRFIATAGADGHVRISNILLGATRTFDLSAGVPRVCWSADGRAVFGYDAWGLGDVSRYGVDAAFGPSPTEDVRRFKQPDRVAMRSDRWIDQTDQGTIVVRSSDDRHGDLFASDVRLDLDHAKVFWSPAGDAVLLYDDEKRDDASWILRIEQGVLHTRKLPLEGVLEDNPWSPDGRALVRKREDGLQIVRIDDGSSFEITAPPGAFPADTVWDQTGSRAAVRWTDHTVDIWSLKDAKRVGGTFHSVWRAPVLSPDGMRLLVFPGWRKAEVHDIAEGEGRLEKETKEGARPVVSLPDFGGRVTAAAFSPSGDRVCLGYDNGVVGVIPLDDPARFVTLRGHSDMVWSVAWSPDGRRLASVSQDGSVAVWETTWPVARAGLDRSPDSLRPMERSVLLGEPSETAQDREAQAR